MRLGLIHSLSLHSTHPAPGVLQSLVTSSSPYNSFSCLFLPLNCQLTLHWFPCLRRFLAESKPHCYFTQHIFFLTQKIILKQQQQKPQVMPTQQFKDKIGTKVSMALPKKIFFCLPGAHSLWICLNVLVTLEHLKVLHCLFYHHLIILRSWRFLPRHPSMTRSWFIHKLPFSCKVLFTSQL